LRGKTLYLPCSSTIDDLEFIERTAMPSRSPSPSDTIARLLLVDGQPLRSRALASGFGHAFAVRLVASEAGSGRRAAEMLRQGAFDIVLMDFASLRDFAISPEDAVARLVKLAAGALTIVLSEAATISAAVAVMRAGAHDFVARPIEANALAERVAGLAQRHGKARLFGVGRASASSDGIIGLVATNIAPRTPATRASRSPILPMWQQEQRIIEEAIASFSGNISLAAAALELSPSTIYRKRQAWAEMETRKGAA
jgi:DNA-binding NtrC family response regulator